LYTDSPVDASLFTLYIHQNYTQYCDEVDHCDGIAEALSLSDSGMGLLGETVSFTAILNAKRLQLIPMLSVLSIHIQYLHAPVLSQFAFHTVSRGALMALPSPVARRSQKMFKPEFFEALERTKKSKDGVADAVRWVHSQAGLFCSKVNAGQNTSAPGFHEGTGHARDVIAVEFGGLLMARRNFAINKGDFDGELSIIFRRQVTDLSNDSDIIPESTYKFASLVFTHPSKEGQEISGQQLGADTVLERRGVGIAGDVEIEEEELERRMTGEKARAAESSKQYLEDDDIDEFA